MATATSPLAEFFELCEKNPDVRYELDEGEIIELGGVSMAHGLVTAQVIRILKNLADKVKDKPLVVNGPGFGLGPRIFRIPDVIAISRKTYEALQLERGWYQGAPELAVEVVSPNDTTFAIDRKRRQYLEAGVESVWIVNYESQHVLAFRADGSVENLVCGQTIQEPKLFGTESIEIASLFADLP